MTQEAKQEAGRGGARAQLRKNLKIAHPVLSFSAITASLTSSTYGAWVGALRGAFVVVAILGLKAGRLYAGRTVV